MECPNGQRCFSFGTPRQTECSSNLSSSYIIFKYPSTSERLTIKSSRYTNVTVLRALANHVVGGSRLRIRCLHDVLLRVPSMTEQKKLKPSGRNVPFVVLIQCTSLEYFIVPPRTLWIKCTTLSNLFDMYGSIHKISTGHNLEYSSKAHTLQSIQNYYCIQIYLIYTFQSGSAHNIRFCGKLDLFFFLYLSVSGYGLCILC